jgi:D-proline reductase (dithiol) PrdB
VNLDHNTMPCIYPRKPLWESRVALVTTGGVHLPEQPRFDIDYPPGDCSYREIPTDACALTWTHAYYAPDRGADLDSVFPLRALRGLATEGAVGEPNRRHFSFMGAIHDPRPLVERTAPQVARKVAADGVDAVLLTPS